MFNHKKYNPQPLLDFKQRTWPDKRHTKAPVWCSVDLRDGNQALEVPMTLEQKLDFFQVLVEIGFKEIEIGFPAASDTEFKFVRALIERGLIPDDVFIQVLTQSREDIIRRTFEAIAGVPRVIVHVYNSTSPVQREVVFQKSRDEIKELAVSGAKLVKMLADENDADFVFEYSPESFSQTEPDYAAEVCNAVLDSWKGYPVIINLPFTVETATPNAHADVIEYMCGQLRNRGDVTVSLHAHNDRGSAVAATELCLLAGADRVEGTLFGNGERTGNADIVTLAMNLYAQGIDPCLDFSNIDATIAIYEQATGMTVHPRHPYAGSLVYTAFSGSHQDAIRKGMAKERPFWDVPYLPIDPKDVGRSYDPIIRINSQSGRGGVAYILESHYDIHIPRPMLKDFGPIATALSDARSAELSPPEVFELFNKTYVNLGSPAALVSWHESRDGSESSLVSGVIRLDGEDRDIRGQGNGVVEAFCRALSDIFGITFDVGHYSQHALGQDSGARANAITYVEIIASGMNFFGAGISSNITNSSLRAVVSAVNRYMSNKGMSRGI